MGVIPKKTANVSEVGGIAALKTQHPGMWRPGVHQHALPPDQVLHIVHLTLTIGNLAKKRTYYSFKPGAA
jgi:hypothetical protein